MADTTWLDTQRLLQRVRDDADLIRAFTAQRCTTVIVSGEGRPRYGAQSEG
jgi:hypothetical protein